MTDSRAITDLEPATREKAEKLLELAKQKGITLLITSTYRSAKRQKELYDQGRTTPGNIVTKAKPGYSVHNFRCAFDVVPVVNGKADWNSPHWATIGALGESVGLEWGGSWKSFQDRPHFQFLNGKTLADLRTQYGDERKEL